MIFCGHIYIFHIQILGLQVCKLLRHISNTEPLVITAEHAESVIKSIGPLVSLFYLTTGETMVKFDQIVISYMFCEINMNKIIYIIVVIKKGLVLEF